MASALPRFISMSLATTDRDELHQDIYLYARYVVQDGAMHGLVSLGSRDDVGVTSPFAKFEVEVASIGGELVHLRSCYNNNYLRKASENPNDVWIAASGKTREEDRTKWSCTLFRPVQVQSSGSSLLTYRFRLLSNNQEFEISQTAHPSNPQIRCLNIVTNQGLVGTPYVIVDLSTLAILPKFVTFKGDNDKYLEITTIGGSLPNAVQFRGDDLSNVRVQYEVVRRRNGAVLIKSSFLERDHYLVSVVGFFNASFDVTNQAILGLVYPITLGSGTDKHVIALKHVATDRYCRRQSGIVTDGLSATSDFIVTECQMTVEPAVQARQVYNVQFMEAKIYDIVPIKTVSKVVVNGSRVSSQEAELSFSYREHEREEWNTSHSWQVGFSWNSTLSARLPVLRFIRGEVSVSLDAGYEGEHSWGKEVERTTEVASKFTVTVPPYTRSRVLMVVNTAKIDVPFSYTQRDTLLNWGTSITKEEDGHFESEGTHIDFEVVEEPLAVS